MSRFAVLLAGNGQLIHRIVGERFILVNIFKKSICVTDSSKFETLGAFFLEGAQMKGIVEDGQAKISFNPLSLFTNINRDQLFIQIRADLYLCSTATGVCKKRTTVIRLNINQTGIGNEQYVQSEFTIADDK